MNETNGTGVAKLPSKPAEAFVIQVQETVSVGAERKAIVLKCTITGQTDTEIQVQKTSPISQLPPGT